MSAAIPPTPTERPILPFTGWSGLVFDSYGVDLRRLIETRAAERRASKQMRRKRYARMTARRQP